MDLLPVADTLQGMRVYTAALLLCAPAVSCGGDSQGTGNGPSDTDGAGGSPPTMRDPRVIASEIEAEFVNLNYCDSVADCRGIGYPTCSKTYVNAGADLTRLTELIQELGVGAEPQDCLAACQCGLLTCTDGVCLASPGDCMGQPDAATLSVCL